MNKQPSFSDKESLALIHRMIDRAKGSIKHSAFYFLLWGWIIAAGSLLHFVLARFTDSAHPEWAWSIVLIGIIVSFWKGYNEHKRGGVMTYPADIIRKVWLAFMVNYAILIIFGGNISNYINPLILLMAGSSTYLSGIIIKFKPLEWGAFFIWIVAIIGFLLPLPYQLLATTTAVLGGYLIPGYMLKRSEV